MYPSISKFSVLILFLLLSLSQSSTAYIDSINIEVGNEYRFEISEYSAFIEINGSTFDIFDMLPVSTNIAVGEKGRIKIDQITDNITLDSTAVSVSGSIEGQDIDGDTYVNTWFNFFNESLNRTVNFVKYLDRDSFNFTFPESSNVSAKDQKEPPPLFATDDLSFYTTIKEDFPFYFDSLIKGIGFTSHTLIIDNNNDPDVFTFELTLFIKEGGLEFGGEWQSNGTTNCLTEINVKDSRVISYHILQESVYQYKEAWWKMLLEFGFKKPGSNEARFKFPAIELLISFLLILPLLRRRRISQF